MRKLVITAALIAAVAQFPLGACTSVIVSGKATPDGRPLMWKNRDTGAPENHVRHCPATESTFAYTAIVNSGAKNPQSVWIGTNSEGFSIMNTVSYNINAIDTTGYGSNGVFMRRALEICADMEDFEHYLDTLATPRHLNTNIGVIDARGNAAYYELGNFERYKYDVNDPVLAPQGYLVRSNFSYNGRPISEGKGHVRYQEADRQMQRALAEGNITPDFFLDNLCRDYCNPAEGFDYRSPDFDGEKVVETDIIVRYRTTCSVVIQGVKPGENPDLTTMWTIVGYPGTTVCMPVWNAAGSEGIPYMIAEGPDRHSPLSHAGFLNKGKSYSYSSEEGPDRKHFKWSVMEEYLDIVLPLEDDVLDVYDRKLERWRKKGSINLKQLTKANSKACALLEDYVSEASESE